MLRAACQVLTWRRGLGRWGHYGGLCHQTRLQALPTRADQAATHHGTDMPLSSPVSYTHQIRTESNSSTYLVSMT